MDFVIAQSPVMHFSDDNGKPLVNGFIDVFLNGTDDRIAVTWGENGQFNTSEVKLNSRGECLILLDYTKVYRFVLHREDGSVVWDIPNIVAQNIADNSLTKEKFKNPKQFIVDDASFSLEEFGKDYVVLKLKKPSETGSYSLKCVDGNIGWVQDG